MDVFSQKWLFPTIWEYSAYYSNIQTIFGPKNLTKYRIEYHYSVPNYSNIQIIRTICSNTGVRDVRRSSRERFRRNPSMSVWLTRTVPWIGGGGTNVSSVGSRSVCLREWSRRWSERKVWGGEEVGYQNLAQWKHQLCQTTLIY